MCCNALYGSGAGEEGSPGGLPGHASLDCRAQRMTLSNCHEVGCLVDHFRTFASPAASLLASRGSPPTGTLAIAAADDCRLRAGNDGARRSRIAQTQPGTTLSGPEPGTARPVAARGLCPGARGWTPQAGTAALRRADARRHRDAQPFSRRDANGRRQNADRFAAALSPGPDRQRRHCWPR